MEAEIVLRCKCGLPWATVQNGQLVVQSKHFGQCHVNKISLAELIRVLCRGAEPEQIPLPLDDWVEVVSG